MDRTLYVVKYTGPFGFIKPWTSVRDSETFSQQFLTPSIVEGIERKLFPELLSVSGIQKIVRHRLSYEQISQQQEMMQTRGWNRTRKGSDYLYRRDTSIIIRGVLINPVLYLAFKEQEDAQRAFSQHICLVRNEDIVFPQEMLVLSESEFDDEEQMAGFELIFERNDRSFPVGVNRKTGEQMYGWLKIVGSPVKSY
ncbi:hypothetical protein HQ45_04345 [Porphyromonas crevioricanis]|uniref:CRISPR-associated protein Cas5 n=2 Tax=Porphyromonas crevioricanis TaxID=393921 RepID=A0A0A2FT83_9PORP|nr:hypothetical protein [Porphyromonas crevioricanis]KGN90053.1 hypothetical protein HQ45_04345 [Porphyromonas crevioricanis]KGN94233.1 hypothetical protein HQ38_06830 [Porphyromonas crevioricanis]SJZ69295.1 hypothetical protein SAMN02745203_00593 [Porphyromonas crevioricanis]SQH72259.1 Uncharacterised protein [Porphyromonas crevioricanis]GAD05082.1 hypothetical protein PORCRE_780 [Porphyromonas crevioricanis JCM 15906]